MRGFPFTISTLVVVPSSNSFTISASNIILCFHSGSSFIESGASAFVEDSREMNAGLDIKDALLVQRMSYWRIRGKHGPIDNCSKRRGRKNYLHLVRKHKRLAQQNNFECLTCMEVAPWSWGGCQQREPSAPVRTHAQTKFLAAYEY